MKKIEAKIIADSISPQGKRITTYLLTYPRFIHAELMTHRLFSRNSASSRAIPFEKMVKMVKEDPFIPIAWQKDHKGMQGSDYIETEDGLYVSIRYWLEARDRAIKAAQDLHSCNITKQLCNRLLEPFMWHTVLVTATEWENFFELRCPQYTVNWYPSRRPEALEPTQTSFKSRKDAIKYTEGECYNWKEQDWRDSNESQAEIHIQALAEAMWDAMNESTPKELKAGEWHIPFGDRIDIEKLANINPNGKDFIKVATARCARLSYMTFDGEIDYEKDIQLHNRLLADGHMSPFEHCARAMNEEEYDSFIKGRVTLGLNTSSGGWGGPPNTTYHPKENVKGWCNNFRGFIPYRYLIENNNDRQL